MNKSLKEALFIAIAAAVTGVMVHIFRHDGLSLSINRPARLTAQDSVFVQELPPVGFQPQGMAPAQARVISFAAVAELVKQNSVVLLDARSREEYRAGHIHGSISIPFEEIGQLMDNIQSLPRERWLVTYCDGPPCDLAQLLAQVLLQNRFDRVAVYDAGVNDWTKQGGKLEQGDSHE
jgi:rhodanese-related sulfurtransferase